MRNLTAIFLTALAMLCPRQGISHTFTGCVERVIDGDTIIVGTNRVRLAEIDAPEMKRPYGAEAKKALSDMILHRTVVVQWKRRGRYRRIIGQVYLDGCDRLREMSQDRRNEMYGTELAVLRIVPLLEHGHMALSTL